MERSNSTKGRRPDYMLDMAAVRFLQILELILDFEQFAGCILLLQRHSLSAEQCRLILQHNGIRFACLSYRFELMVRPSETNLW